MPIEYGIPAIMKPAKQEQLPQQDLLRLRLERHLLQKLINQIEWHHYLVTHSICQINKVVMF